VGTGFQGQSEAVGLLQQSSANLPQPSPQGGGEEHGWHQDGKEGTKA